MRDIDRTDAEFVEKYGVHIEKNKDLVYKDGCVRRSRANGDFMDEMEAGLLCHSIVDDGKLSLVELEKKHWTLTLITKGLSDVFCHIRNWFDNLQTYKKQ